MSEVNEEQIIALLNFDMSPEQIASELDIPLSVVNSVEDRVNNHTAKSSDQIKSQIEKKLQMSIEEMIINTLVDIVQDSDALPSARINAGSDLREWLEKDGKQIDVPDQVRKLSRAMELAEPKIFTLPEELPNGETKTSSTAEVNSALDEAMTVNT
tara:strand:- start:6133 stop:6600 length:468 start_codon:yes stop_codon:yes gene_type:complete